MRHGPRLLLLAALSLAPPLAAQGGSVAVRAGRIFLAPGQTIDDGTLLIRAGRVAAVGDDKLEIPFDLLLHEFPDGVVFPGFALAHSSSGMDRPNENVPVAPFLDVKDSIDPVSFYFEDMLRNGTVAIGILPGNRTVFGGRGRVVAPHGMTVEAMTLLPDAGVKIAFGPKRGWSRAAQLAELREALDRLEDQLRRKGQELLDKAAEEADRRRAGAEVEEPEEDGDEADSQGGFVRFGPDYPGKELISEEDLDDTQRALVRILNGDDRLWLWAPAPVDVVHALDWAETRGLLEQVVLVVRPEAWKAAERIAASGRPVFLTGGLWHVEHDPLTWKERRTFVPKVFQEHGIVFAVDVEAGTMGPDRLAHQAATCVREGLTRAQALAAVTTAPARMWGAEGRMGVLQEGADGTFVVLDGDPLAATTRILQVWVRGEKVYDRNEDERLRRLLEGSDQ